MKQMLTEGISLIPFDDRILIAGGDVQQPVLSLTSIHLKTTKPPRALRSGGFDLTAQMISN
jgi:hypothetical protein